MALTEVHCLNCDNEFELADCCFTLIYLHETHVWNARFRLTGKSDYNTSFSRIYQGERPFAKQHKSSFHSWSLNSQVSFTIVMPYESFLWRNRHKYSLIKCEAFWLVTPVFGNPVQLDINEAYQTITLCEGEGAARLSLDIAQPTKQTLSPTLAKEILYFHPESLGCFS